MVLQHAENLKIAERKTWVRSLLDTLWKKKKILVNSIFSFSHHVCLHRKISVLILFPTENAFNWDEAKDLFLGEGLEMLRKHWPRDRINNTDEDSF